MDISVLNVKNWLDLVRRKTGIVWILCNEPFMRHDGFQPHYTDRREFLVVLAMAGFQDGQCLSIDISMDDVPGQVDNTISYTISMIKELL